MTTNTTSSTVRTGSLPLPINGEVTDLRLGNRRIKYGCILRFHGTRGEFEFRKARVVAGECEWLQVVGGTDKRNGFRYFTPDKIAAVVRSPKTKRFASAEVQVITRGETK